MSRKKKNKMQPAPDNKAVTETPNVKSVLTSSENKTDQSEQQNNGLSIEMDKRAFE